MARVEIRRPGGEMLLLILLCGLAYGLLPMLLGVFFATAEPVTTPTCHGVPMSPAETCLQDIYISGRKIGHERWDYDRMLASQQHDVGDVLWAIGLGLVSLGLSGWAMCLWFRKRRRYQRAREEARMVT